LIGGRFRPALSGRHNGNGYPAKCQKTIRFQNVAASPAIAREIISFRFNVQRHRKKSNFHRFRDASSTEDNIPENMPSKNISYADIPDYRSMAHSNSLKTGGQQCTSIT
jgi:hypothetical protein